MVWFKVLYLAAWVEVSLGLSQLWLGCCTLQPWVQVSIGLSVLWLYFIAICSPGATKASGASFCSVTLFNGLGVGLVTPPSTQMTLARGY